jgi:hypothetical protein
MLVVSGDCFPPGLLYLDDYLISRLLLDPEHP